MDDGHVEDLDLALLQNKLLNLCQLCQRVWDPCELVVSDLDVCQFLARKAGREKGIGDVKRTEKNLEVSKGIWQVVKLVVADIQLREAEEPADLGEQGDELVVSEIEGLQPGELAQLRRD